MFKDFDIKPFKKKKPPVDSGYTTRTEINELKKIPLNKKFVKDYDNIESAFAKTAKEQGVKDYDKNIAAKLIKESAPVILELKKYHNRKRPYELDKKLSAFAKTGENISYSRRVARAHYKSDSKTGEDLGNSMFNFIKNKI